MAEPYVLSVIEGRLSRRYKFQDEATGHTWTDDGHLQQQDIALLLSEVRRLQTALAASCEENRSVALAQPGRTASCPLVEEDSDG